MHSAKKLGKDFTTGMIAKRLGCAPRTVTKWCDSGRLKARRLPGSHDRRIPRQSLVEFLRDYGYPYDDLIDSLVFRVLLIGVNQAKAFTEALTVGAGFEVMQAANGFHAARLAFTRGVDAAVIDFSIGRTNAKELAAELPINDGRRPFVCGIVGDDEPEPYAVAGFDFLVRTGGEAEIVERIKAKAKARAAW